MAGERQTNPHQAFAIRWDDTMGCYRVSIPNYEGGQVVPIEVHKAQAAEIVALLRSYADVHMTKALADLIEHKYVNHDRQRGRDRA